MRRTQFINFSCMTCMTFEDPFDLQFVSGFVMLYKNRWIRNNMLSMFGYNQKTYITVIQRTLITNQMHVRCTIRAMVYFTLLKIVFEKPLIKIYNSQLLYSPSTDNLITWRILYINIYGSTILLLQIYSFYKTQSFASNNRW